MYMLFAAYNVNCKWIDAMGHSRVPEANFCFAVGISLRVFLAEIAQQKSFSGSAGVWWLQPEPCKVWDCHVQNVASAACNGFGTLTGTMRL